MADSPAKVRLVRCPKCENLLPEITDYAVYQCGGCGAVLCAGNKHMDSGLSSEKSSDESDAVQNKISRESVNLDFSNRSHGDRFGPENGVESNVRCRSRADKDNNNTDIDEQKSRRSVWASNWRYHEGDHQEGSSSYHNAPQYAELVKNTNDLQVDDDQAELLRKLDELKYEIVRSRNKSYTHQQNHPLIANLNQVQVLRSQNHRRNLVMPFKPNPYHPYYSGSYVGNDITDNRLFHHPSCSCLACYSKHHQVPPPPLPPDPVFYHHDYNLRFSNLSMNSHSSEPKTRWSSEIRRPPRGILSTGARRCSPVIGGSPLIACCTCFELLQVPKMKTKKMRCAACSAVMLLSVVNKQLVISVYTETDNGPEKSTYDHKTLGDAKSGGTDFSSEDFDNSGNFDFESIDKLQHRGPSLTSYKSVNSYASDDEIKVNIILDENSVDLAVDAHKPSPPPLGSPLQDHFDYSTTYNRAGKGNVSRRSEMERAEKPVNFGTMKDAAVASKIEISSNEYCVNTGLSQESRDTIRETDQQRGNKSFFVGMIKKSFREFSRSGQHVDQGKVNVTVNGHPIPDRLVKKAENLAGTIQPGDYWYDPKAGFWGMMDGPCRGIIPPFIEEFNYPLPEKCADGNTNVFVNGRELHQSDLDLLVSRGLPTDSDRSYIIDISGSVFDEDSGLELEGLGKLAPTVERKKQGFGMKPPRTTV